MGDKEEEEVVEEETTEEAVEEEEVVDPMDKIRESTAKSCIAYSSKLESCNARVESKTATEENCAEEMMDLQHCIDGHSWKQVFKAIK